MKRTKTIYACDLCEAELPDDYVSTDGEGYSYFVKNAYDEIPLDEAIKGCESAVVHVRVGGVHDKDIYNDLCDKCRLDILKQAVAHLEQKVGVDNA